MLHKEAFVIELEHCQVDARCNRNHAGVDFVARAIGLYLHQGRVGHHVRIGQNAVAIDYHARAGAILRRLFGPRFESVWRARG